MGTIKDDRIHTFTRIVSASIIVVLLLAILVLYVETSHTDLHFAWTIQPPSSAILIGAGYSAGAFFFARLLGQKKWHRVQAGFLPITAFTIFMLAATLLHWGRFHHGTFAFYLWTAIYIMTPFLVPIIWWRNHVTESVELEEHDLRFSLSTRWGLGIGAAIGILAFLVLFIWPALLMSSAPWKLTELTARVFTGWSILTLGTIVTIALDGRWSATRILLESALVALGLTLLSLPRIWNDLDHTKPMTYIFITGVVITLIAFIVIHQRLDKASRKYTSS